MTIGETAREIARLENLQKAIDGIAANPLLTDATKRIAIEAITSAMSKILEAPEVRSEWTENNQ